MRRASGAEFTTRASCDIGGGVAHRACEFPVKGYRVATMRILITGGSGYIGTRVGKLLAGRDHSVRALVRAESVARLPSGVQPVIGNALDPTSIAAALASGDTLVHLVG